MKRLALLLIAVPLAAQTLPPLSPVPSAPVPTVLAVEPGASPLFPASPPELKPLVVTQTLIQTVTQTVLVAETPKAIIKASPKKEMSWREYKAAKRALYEQLRASEPIFRRSGHWSDFSFMSRGGYFPHSQRQRSFPHYELYFSAGRVYKGFMAGFSYQYTFAQEYVALKNGSPYSLPGLHEGALVFGYRIPTDKIIGMRVMFHLGAGGSYHGEAQSPLGSIPVFYVLLMPELKIDLRLYKSLALTFGIAYKAAIPVGRSAAHMDTLQQDFGFNGLQGLRYSVGLAYTY